MSWNGIVKQSGFRSVLSVLLILAILLSIFQPGIHLHRAEPAPPAMTGYQEITVLKLGEEVRGLGGAPETEPPETKPLETQPRETEPSETESTETEPTETEPQQSEPEESETDATEPEDQKPEDGGNVSLDLSLVMTWFKYGEQPATIVCAPNEAVSRSVNAAQLTDSKLQYGFQFHGQDADAVQIQSVSVAEGNLAGRAVESSGTVAVNVPSGGYLDYTFTVLAQAKTTSPTGQTQLTDMTFTFVLRCEYKLDLELKLNWTDKSGRETGISCAADATVRRTVENGQLNESKLVYSLQLMGALAEDGTLVSGEYTTASGESSGKLNLKGGSIPLQTAVGSQEETYYLSFAVELPDRVVTYRYAILFRNVLDVRLKFTWLEKGSAARTLVCGTGSNVRQEIRTNQLSAGGITYELALEGSDTADARIYKVTCSSDDGGSRVLDNRTGTLPMSLPENYVSNTYVITVQALVRGQDLRYQISLILKRDISLQMRYWLTDGESAERSVICENGKTVQTEEIYDDQLRDGMLRYEMGLTGAQSGRITAVRCYQSGTGTAVSLAAADQVKLSLNRGQTGENTFTVFAEDGSGREYTFTVMVPYKHRGENRIKIQTNLKDGQQVTNDSALNLSVEAWSEDEKGNILEAIPANGVDTRLNVQLDGIAIPYTSSSGRKSEYTLLPTNPETGDTNDHILYIYAEDSYGNYGELTLTLKGQRAMEGQVKGKASIYVDLACLGLDQIGPIDYTVLAGEPVSYVVLKAIGGQDMGEPFGRAEEALGWAVRYGGTPKSGFYLQSLSTGLSANAMDMPHWPGSSEDAVLQAVDDRFEKEKKLASLWRCLYRNGLNKSGGSGGTFGEFDYTSGSGWMYSIGGATYYPGQSMSQVFLEDGAVLTLRYTLAYGWDVGGGSPGYGNTVGYCVTALNGRINVEHKMEQKVYEDGSIHYLCKCCGLEACPHNNTEWKDLGDEFHIQHCMDCNTDVGDPEPHIWGFDETGECHECVKCGKRETHLFRPVEGSNTATCTQPGTVEQKCALCGYICTVDSPVKGHTFGNAWEYSHTEHWRHCDTCNEIIGETRGEHTYQYDPDWDSFLCTVCQCDHDFDCCGNEFLEINSATCQQIEYRCTKCGLKMVRTGSFEEYHSYVNGSCILCGKADPNAPTEPPETQPPETQPPETQPPETEPTETDPTETPPEV